MRLGTMVRRATTALACTTALAACRLEHVPYADGTPYVAGAVAARTTTADGIAVTISSRDARRPHGRPIAVRIPWGTPVTAPDGRPVPLPEVGEELLVWSRWREVEPSGATVATRVVRGTATWSGDVVAVR